MAAGAGSGPGERAISSRTAMKVSAAANIV